MHSHSSKKLALLTALGVALASATHAQSPLPVPASLLIHPEIDHTPGRNTLITVTNTNLDPIGGSIYVRFVYVSGDTCLLLDRTEPLTPGDTFTTLSSFHDPEPGRGYLYMFAVSLVMQDPVSFNHLIGCATLMDGVSAFQYEVQPFAFRAVGAQGTETDVDRDGRQDLNGVEYEKCFDELRIPRFHGQAANAESHLVLLNLTGAAGFDVVVDFLVRNDNQTTFSEKHLFRCWTKTPLDNVGQTFQNDFLQDFSNHDPNEPIGAPAIENGWMRIDGNAAFSDDCSAIDPAILGFLIERIGGLDPTASLPFVAGEQANASLIEYGTMIDGCLP